MRKAKPSELLNFLTSFFRVFRVFRGPIFTLQSLMQKWANIDFTLCKPSTCDQQCGLCHAATACTRKLLLQEDPYEEPMLISTKMCVGCGDCVKACPLKAIEILSGY